jgi:DNA-binding transcriptional LysR family regulator
MQIRALENRLGIELFHRAGRNISLTEAGHALVPMARDLINLSIRTEEAMASLQGRMVGHLKLACSTSAGKYVLPKLIARFIEEHPDVRVTCNVIHREPALQMLCDGDAHLSVTSKSEPARNIEYHLFTTDPVVLIVPPDHQWTARESIAPLELFEGSFVMREATSGTLQAVAEALSEHGINLPDLPTVMELSNTEAILMTVIEGIGAAFISQRTAAEAIANGRVAVVPVEGVEIVQQLYMGRNTRRAATHVQTAFWNFIYAPENAAILSGDALDEAASGPPLLEPLASER